MTRALVHVGLAVAIAFAPALCCCQVGWFANPHLAARAHAGVPQPPAGSCCVKAQKTCCDRPTAPTGVPHAPECACSMKRPDAVPHEGPLAETAPRPTGELLSLALAGLYAGFPAHADTVRAAHPPDRAGVDARFAALYERHVMRC